MTISSIGLSPAASMCCDIPAFRHVYRARVRLFYEVMELADMNTTKGKTERREKGIQWRLHDMALMPAVDDSLQLVWSKENKG